MTLRQNGTSCSVWSKINAEVFMNLSARSRLRRAIKPTVVRLITSLPDGIQRTLMRPSIKRYVIHLPLIKGVYSGCYRRHPIDALLGTDTSGFVDTDRLTDDPLSSAENNAYMGCQPSIVRQALGTLPAVEGATFIDLGCGKGRAMIVATEFPFQAVLGCDINRDLVASANANAKIIAARFPERTSMHALASDVRGLTFPPGRLVVFLYNPFGASLLRDVVSRLLSALDAGTLQHLFIVYYNPVSPDVLDKCTELKRWSADTYDYAPNEIDFGPSLNDTVIVWQSVANAIPGESATCQRRVKVTGSSAYLD